MSTINRLSSVDALQPGDLMPIWDGSNGDTRKASMTTLLAYITSNFVDPDYTTRIIAPSATAFTIDAGSTGDSLWLIVNPVAAYASGSIWLPPATSAVDGQEIVVTFTAAVTALSFSAVGATVSGFPSGVDPDDTFRLRYNTEQLTWYAISSAELREIVSVKGFAVGDDSDETTGLQAALTHCAGGTLELERGKVYRATEALTMLPNTTLELNGSILSFAITGQKRCLVTADYCTVRNGTVRNVTTDTTVYGGEWHQPVCIGLQDGLENGVHDVLAEYLTITSTSPEGNAIFVFGESYNITVDNITIPDSIYLGEPIGGHWSVEPGGDQTQGTGHPNNLVFSNIYVGSLSYATSQAVCFLSACRTVRLENIYCKDIEHGDLVQVYAGDHGFTYAIDSTAAITGSMVTSYNIHGKCRSAFRVDMRDTLESQDVWPSSILFENCNVMARDTTDSDAHGVRVAGCDGVKISNCQFNLFYNSVFLDSSVSNLVVRDNFFKRSYKSAVDADNSTSCINLEFTNNKFFLSNTAFLTVGGTGYDMVFGSYIEDITISENVFDSPSATFNVLALDTAPPSNMKVINNQVLASAGTNFVFGNSVAFGICTLFNGNSQGQTVTANIRGGQAYVPHLKTSYKNTPLENNQYIGAGTPDFGTYNAGDIVFDNTPSASGSIGTVCVVSGTQGTYSEGRTATTDGTTSVALSAASNVLRKGDYVTINSVDVRITSILLTAVIVSATIAAGSGLAIAYDTATFKTFGAISA